MKRFHVRPVLQDAKSRAWFPCSRSEPDAQWQTYERLQSGMTFGHTRHACEADAKFAAKKMNKPTIEL